MAGQKAKGLAPDAVLKHYWNGNEEFADLFNAVLFEGRKIIKPGELETADTEQSAHRLSFCIYCRKRKSGRNRYAEKASFSELYAGVLL